MPGSEKGPEQQVDLQNPNRYPEVDVAALRPWIEGLISDMSPGSSLAVRFVGDRRMRRLNSDFRGRDSTTDVLSFPGEESPEGHHLGDIAISVPVARRQALAGGHHIGRELRVLMLHGVLHCLGYDHESDDGTMKRVEKRLRRKWIDRDA